MTAPDGLHSFPRGTKSVALAQLLRQGLAEGRWPVGVRLPTEHELSREHQVGINTVRRAINVLGQEGLLQRRQGSGTFVLAVPPPAPGARRLVGVLVPSTSYFYPKVIEGIERVLSAAGVRMMLSSSDYDLALEEQQTRHLLQAGVDGLLLVPNLHMVEDPQAHVDRLHELPVPYVLVERRPANPAPDDATAYVCSNHLGGAYAAVRHLAELGHRRIGHLGRVNSPTGAPVAEAFHRASDELGLEEVPEAVVLHGEWMTQEELAAYAQLCREHEITAVFCLGDRDAAGLLPHLRRVGLSVPRDLSIVAYDDEVAEIGEVPLTTVAPPKSEVGALAAELLLRRLESGPAIPVPQVQLRPRLVLRSSTAPMRVPVKGSI
ncbi:GntR family transcriptional regulator [Kribbella antibiotica]|uniref:GntR family transcriptional regulator n=1 Tax=Kribbella antibiotica TaxID=190195 RepID=A0A4R4ZK14_9ACTN|nr:GntR family transcriptional regulator [Kribbella antibiotica]TDD58855.1 GntR family transcriptional regulator [Kribbella antibiotica]